MPIDGYTTTVDAAQTAGEISGLLAKAGARSVMTEYSSNGRPSGMSFLIQTEYGERAFSLPIRVDGVLATLKRDRVAPKYQTPEHAEKVAWRVAKVWLRAQLALIDAGQTSLAEIMFPWMLQGAGQEGAYAWYVSKQKAIEA